MPTEAPPPMAQAIGDLRAGRAPATGRRYERHRHVRHASGAARRRAPLRRGRDRAPIAAELDETERFPRELYARAGRSSGLFGITVPEALGGAGADALAYALVMEELSRGYASVADQCRAGRAARHPADASTARAAQQDALPRARCCAPSGAAPMR